MAILSPALAAQAGRPSSGGFGQQTPAQAIKNIAR
jgi:hypothetical protein